MKSSISIVIGIGSICAMSLGFAVSRQAAAADPGKAKSAAAAPGKTDKDKSGKTAAAPAVPAVALEVDGVAFGASAEDVAKVYDRWWDKHFVSKYRKVNPGPKMKELDFELAEKKKIARRVSIFDGRSSLDKAPFREEFEHHNGETMTSVKVVRAVSEGSTKGVSYTRRFFFFQDKLWKIYDEYKLEAQGLFGADFKEATAKVEASAGAGAKRTRGPDSKYENVTFEAGPTRVRVVKLADDRVAIVRSDNALAQEVLDRRALQAKQPESELDEDIQAVIR
jgi:hypothetical protein